MNRNILKTFSHGAFKISYRIIFTTKSFEPSILPDMKECLKHSFETVLGKWGCSLIDFEGGMGHVSLKVDAHPALDLSRMIGSLKSVSSRKMRTEFPDVVHQNSEKGQFWERFYAVFSTDGEISKSEVLEILRQRNLESAKKSKVKKDKLIEAEKSES